MGIRYDMSLAHTPKGKPVLFCDICKITLKTRLTKAELTVYTNYRRTHTCYGILYRECPEEQLKKERLRRIVANTRFKQPDPMCEQGTFNLSEEDDGEG